MDTRFHRALAAIDARNADDPHGKEQRHAEMAVDWVRRLRPDASEPLLLAARGHHLRRWTIPRADFGEGRVAYLKWRRALQDVHAAELRAALESAGYGVAEVDRAEFIVRKRDLGRDADVQALEDALCLVFLETQFHGLARQLDREKMVEVLVKTMRKMSPQARGLAFSIPVAPEDRALLDDAAGRL
jgi:hypothetical protein